MNKTTHPPEPIGTTSGPDAHDPVGLAATPGHTDILGAGQTVFCDDHSIVTRYIHDIAQLRKNMS